MDHLIYPENPGVPPLSVPFLCTGCTEYDNLEFCSYPYRQRWASEDEPLAWLSCEAEELARRAQVWLYFGTLSDFLGEHIAASSFESSTGNLTTRSLPGLLWGRRHAYLPSSSTKRAMKSQSSDKTTQLLKNAARFSELLEQRLTDSTGALALVACSVKVLLEELNSAREHLKPHGVAANHLKPTTGPKSVSYEEARWRILTPQAIKHQMLLGGWCPAQIYFLSQKYSCRALYYVSGLCGNSGASHSRCIENICTANTIDEHNFQPKHASDGCECSHVGPPSAHIASIIGEGKIPVVSGSLSTATGELQLEITRAHHKMRYVAISHVWSGGLGNPRGNAIPSCQFSRLIHLVRQLLSHPLKSSKIRSIACPNRPVYFWLDTLCIPVGNAYQTARQAAIDMMAKIYSGAAHVLVLDVYLQNIVFDRLPLEQALGHILSCSWMFRCWTLQEAALGQSCYVQFADRAVALGTHSRSLRLSKIETWLDTKSYPKYLRLQLIKNLSRFLRDIEDVSWRRPDRTTMWSRRDQENHQAHAFACTWNSFLGRFTSKMEDLHLMIAGMQDYKVSPMRELPVRDRMKAILKGHAVLPLALLYIPGPRLDNSDPQRSWAPAFPQSNELDCSLGYMKVYSDCLLLTDGKLENSRNFPEPNRYSSPRLMATSDESVRETLSGEWNQPQSLPYTCLITSKACLHDNFTLDVKYGFGSEKLWFEACKLDNDELSRLPARKEESMTCLLFPNLEEYSHRADWYSFQGARFHVRKRDNLSLHLIYDCPLDIYAYDRTKVNTTTTASTNTTDNSPNLRRASFEPITASQLPLTHRIFIDCDLSGWPSVPHFFTSDEGPFGTHAVFWIYIAGWDIIHALWVPFFIVLLAGASSPRFHMQGDRLPLLYFYIAKLAHLGGEYHWWTRIVFENMERIAWSEEFGSTTNEIRHSQREDNNPPAPGRPSYYELLNQEPSLYLGLKRSILMIAVAAGLLSYGFSRNIESRGCAQWAGVMVVIELIVRSLMYITWLRLPATVLGMWLRRRVIWRWWPWVREKGSKYRRQKVKSEQEMERSPFQEDAD